MAASYPGANPRPGCCPALGKVRCKGAPSPTVLRLQEPPPLLPTSSLLAPFPFQQNATKGDVNIIPKGAQRRPACRPALPAACLLHASRTTTQPSASPALGGKHSGAACLSSSFGRHNPALACLRPVCPDPLCCRPGALHCQRELRGRHGGPHLLRCCWACRAVPCQHNLPPLSGLGLLASMGCWVPSQAACHPIPSSPLLLQAT